jgi:glucose-1-phosphate cytidylyltransferase
MKVVILAGGYGSRLLEETVVKPKPMVEIGGRPILWHIMNSYACAGFKEFVVALGYKSEYIKDYFLSQLDIEGSLSLNLATSEVRRHDRTKQDWLLHLMETGMDPSTGGRLMRLRSMLEKETFMMTYGDGLSNVDINALLAHHRSHGKCATVTAVRPPARFGVLKIDNKTRLVKNFGEKPQLSEGWINGGFFVFEPEVFNYLDDEHEPIEGRPLKRLAADGQLSAFQHEGFWQCMDTLRDVRYLEYLWNNNQAPWNPNQTPIESA